MAHDDPDNLGLASEYESDPTHRLHCEEIVRQWIDAGLRPNMIAVEE